MAAALGTFLLLTPQSTYHTDIVPAMVFLGAGGTIVMVIGSDAATRNTGTLSGTASSLVNATQQLGAAIGTTPLTSIALLAPRPRHRRRRPRGVDADLAAIARPAPPARFSSPLPP